MFRAGTSGFGDTEVCAAAMPADERHARMTAANRAIILGRKLPQTPARSLTVVTCDRPGVDTGPLPRDASAPALAADCPPLLQQ